MRQILDLVPVLLLLILADNTADTDSGGLALLIKGRRVGECTMAVAPWAVVGWWQWYKVEWPCGRGLKLEQQVGGVRHKSTWHEPPVAQRWVELGP
jgi:hypothetical protein